MLCSNRPDGGFGPYYTGQGLHVLTTCFDDVLLIPLGCMVFIIFTIILTGIMWQRRTPSTEYLKRTHIEALPSTNSIHSGSHTAYPPTSIAPTNPNINHSWIRRKLAPAGGIYGSGKWPKTRKACLILTTFLLLALIAMHALEIARLIANSNGIGLLPFTFIPLIIVLASLYLPAPTWSRGGWVKPVRPHGVAWIVGVSVWAVWMAITTGIKLWSLSRVYRALGDAGYDGTNSKYPYSDKLIDNIVICAVYYSFLNFYLHNIYFEYIRYEFTWFV